MGSLEKEPGSHFTGRPTANPVETYLGLLKHCNRLRSHYSQPLKTFHFYATCFIYYLHHHLYLLMHCTCTSQLFK
jgi:hypothetical protein